ncbi:MAG: dihydrodipicolinate synthase family protein, partial [SAR324 cluster bacterium]|nr:dihydrodipicolinate synthase family protein [SAR324 cluster bacterium]
MMNTQNITPEQLTNSVISVPPLARTVEGGISIPENRKIVEHLQKGGVRTFLYGGNAVMYHLSSREFKDVLEMMTEFSSADSLMIPSVGPFYGAMMDQAKILQQFDFPTAMILPTRDMTTSVGIANGIRRFVDYFGKPVVLYIKNDGYIGINEASTLMEEGLLSFIKYAIVRKDPSQDPFLEE